MKLYIEQFYDKVSKRSKVTFATTAIISSIVHGFMLSNHLFCSDSIWSFWADNDMVCSGRWFLTYAAGISSWFDLHWLNGVLSILYISATVTLIVKLLDIKNIFLGCLAGLFIGTYPTVSKTFAYMYTADAYFMAMSFATLAAYLFIQDKWEKRLAGSILCALSMGIYQAYITFLLNLLILWMIKQIITKQDITFLKIWNLFYSGLLGGYYIILY